MTHERIEAALRGDTPADEGGYRPRPLPATAAEARVQLAAMRRPARGIALAGVVAAAALVIAAGWALGTIDSDDGGIDVGNGGTPSPGPSEAGVLPACGPDDFLVASDPWGGAAGSRGTTIVLRVVDSTAACVKPQTVGAEIRDADGTVLAVGVFQTFGGRPAPTARLAAGTQVELGVAWSNWCGAPPTAPTLSLLLDSVSVPVEPSDGSAILVPPCMGVGQPTTLSVTDLQPSERPPIGG
jgi:hypothetical protein